MAAFSEEIVEIKCDPHKILNNTYLYRFFCSKFKSFHSKQGPKYYLLTHILPRFYQHILPVHRSNLNIITTFLMGFLSNCD